MINVHPQSIDECSRFLISIMPNYSIKGGILLLGKSISDIYLCLQDVKYDLPSSILLQDNNCITLCNLGVYVYGAVIKEGIIPRSDLGMVIWI